MIRKCVICGAEFQAQRSTAKYCSNACRLRAQRGFTYEGPIPKPRPDVSMSEAEIAGTILSAKNVAADLSRASLMTPYPICAALRRVSQRLYDALEREGL